MEVLADQRPEVERDCVVEERLADEQREPEHRAVRVLLQRRAPDRAERDLLALTHGDRLARLVAQRLPGLRLDRLLDVADDPLRLLVAAVDEQPARALRHVAADEQDHEAEHDADAEREPPAEVGREHVRVEEEQRGKRAERGAEPVAAVDDQVDAAAHARRDQLVDRRVDRRILAADPRAREEARHEQVPGREREGGRRGRDEIDAERDQEQLLAAEAVGQLAEEECADAGAANVERRSRADLARVELDAAARLGESRRDRADDRHLEPVEDPDRPEADHDQPVEARPRQPVEPGRDARLNGPELR